MKPKKKNQDERADRLDALTLRLSNQLHGETLFDAASVCAMMCAWAIKELYPTHDTRIAALGAMWQFMMEVVTKNEDGQTPFGNSNGE